MSMPLVYVAGPFTADNAWNIEKNIRNAEEWILPLAQMGCVPVVPHTLYRYFTGTMTPEFWYEATADILARCHAVLLIDGWTKSLGAKAEKQRAEDMGFSVFDATILDMGLMLSIWIRNFKKAHQL